MLKIDGNQHSSSESFFIYPRLRTKGTQKSLANNSV